MATQETTQACPICSEATLRSARCSHVSCSFSVITCARCDRAQAVAAFVADHEKDCVYRTSEVLVSRPATFVAPRRVA